jgi:glycosyltransferase involved in cell wall biosynthesis
VLDWLVNSYEKVMRVLFIGQRGIPVLSYKAGILREKRVQALAEVLIKKGHAAVVLCAQPFISRHLTSFNGVKLIHRFSLNPEKPGGWIHSIFELATLWKEQPDVVHIHGWKLAIMVRMAVLLSPESTFIWTIDSVPNLKQGLVRLVARRAALTVDVVTVPTRKIQYTALSCWGVRARYVPDGYHEISETELARKELTLRKDQYCLCTATSSQDIRRVAQAYSKAKTKKKLVILQERKGYLKRLAKEFPSLLFAGELSGRRLKALINGAAVVIVAGEETSIDTLFQIMDSRKAVVAMTGAGYEEILGVSAQYYKDGDVAGLTELLKGVVANVRTQKSWGNKAKLRACKNFQWSQIASEYISLYHYPLVRTVAIDSAFKPSFTKLPAVKS